LRASSYQYYKKMNTNSSFAIQHIRKAFDTRLKQVQDGNKYIILYKSIKQCINQQELPENWVVPSTRQLAEALNLSRTTVIKAYELLLLEKLISAKAGSGYRVRVPEAEKPLPKADEQVLAQYPSLSDKGRAFFENISILNRQTNTGIAFKPGIPPIDIFPINAWKNLLNSYWRYVKSSELSYEQGSGMQMLKSQIATYLHVSRNIKCQPEQVMVVSGSLQSIYLLASALINKGDAVVLEDPTFPNVHSIFKSNLAELIPVGLDNAGIAMAGLQAAAARHPKLVHLTPSDHYPLGIKMSLQRRMDVVQWASKNNAYIIENDYEHEIGNAEQSLPCIYSLDQEHRTIYLGTFNRLLYPSIRLGFMVLPPQLVQVVQALLEHSHRFVSPSLQIVMGQFIEKNYLYRHLKNLAEVGRERQTIFEAAFTERNKRMYLAPSPFNSLHLLARFQQPTKPQEERLLIAKLAEHQISAYSLSKCYIERPADTGLILGFSTVRPVVLREQVRQMLRIMHE
jgi:GntR family transcriptional regulator/MocR family aminotransferase